MSTSKAHQQAVLILTLDNAHASTDKDQLLWYHLYMYKEALRWVMRSYQYSTVLLPFSAMTHLDHLLLLIDMMMTIFCSFCCLYFKLFFGLWLLPRPHQCGRLKVHLVSALQIKGKSYTYCEKLSTALSHSPLCSDPLECLDI